MANEALGGKVIVVIGGTSGMGLSAARAIVAAGGRVVALGKDDATALQAQNELGDAGRVFAADATQPGSAERAIQLALDAWGRIDGLYHVAGGSGRRMGDGPLHELSDDGWDYTLGLNLRSVFLSNRAAVRQFIKQDEASPAMPPRGGAILNTGSVVGWSPSVEHFATHAYATAKSAIVGMSVSAAAYYARANIRVNVIAPGLVETPMSQRAVGDPRIMRFIQTKQPLGGGRAGQAADLDGAAVFLLSDQAAFVTGQVLAVDGGWCVTEGQVGA